MRRPAVTAFRRYATRVLADCFCSSRGIGRSRQTVTGNEASGEIASRRWGCMRCVVGAAKQEVSSATRQCNGAAFRRLGSTRWARFCSGVDQSFGRRLQEHTCCQRKRPARPFSLSPLPISFPSRQIQKNKTPRTPNGRPAWEIAPTEPASHPLRPEIQQAGSRSGGGGVPSGCPLSRRSASPKVRQRPEGTLTGTVFCMTYVVHRITR